MRRPQDSDGGGVIGVQTESGLTPLSSDVSHPLNVLLVEDSAADRWAVRRALDRARRFDAVLFECETLEEAVRLARANPFDLVILDLSLPDATGLESLVRLDPWVDGAPIIVLTGTDDEALGLKLIASGAQDYIVKQADIAPVLERSALYALERSRFRSRLENLALEDPMTGLPNRRALVRDVERALARCDRLGQCIGLLVLDIDRFKSVNDTLGHLAGDALLVEVARVLTSSLRGGDCAYRLGGDEFAVVVDVLTGPRDVDSVAGRITRLANEAIDAMLADARASASVSIGGAVAPDDGAAFNTLFAEADRRMYANKAMKRDSVA